MWRSFPSFDLTYRRSAELKHRCATAHNPADTEWFVGSEPRTSGSGKQRTNPAGSTCRNENFPCKASAATCKWVGTLATSLAAPFSDQQRNGSGFLVCSAFKWPNSTISPSGACPDEWVYSNFTCKQLPTTTTCRSASNDRCRKARNACTNKRANAGAADCLPSESTANTTDASSASRPTAGPASVEYCCCSKYASYYDEYG